MINKERILNDFLDFVKIDTSSDPNAKTIPSTPGQMELAKIVASKFEEAGISENRLTENGFLFGTIPSNLPSGKNVPVIGFLSHFDTTYEVDGKNVKPQVIRNYSGDGIEFSGNTSLSITAKENPNLAKCVGHTIITSDGTTLLGGDCKMGIAIMLEVARYFQENQSAHHGKIRLSIVPDEETALGFDKFDVKEFGANIAYTLDGLFLGDMDIESINASKASISVKGNTVYPGYGKGIYLNTNKILCEFVTEMVNVPWPENSEGKEPYWWIENLKGSSGAAEVTVFMRSFDLDQLSGQATELYKIKDHLLKKHPMVKIEIAVSEMYRNYKEHLDKDKRVVEYAKEAMRNRGITPNPLSLRGGNDACHLCAEGIIATNLFIGMQNFHSLKEWISLEVAEKSAETVIELCKIWGEEKI